MSLYKYIFKRLLITIPTILGILIITFFLTRLIPGNPVYYRLPIGRASLEDIQREEARLGLDKPVIVQFIIFMTDMFTGNWGFSFGVDPNVLVWDLIIQHLPRSLEVMVYSLILATAIGSRLGKISGANQNSRKDAFIRGFTYLLVSVPAFVVVVFLIELYVSTPLRILPMYGYKTIQYPDPPIITNIRMIDCIISGKFYLALDYLWHMIIPLSAMTIVQLVVITRHTRSSMIEVLGQNYINTARVKGCNEKDVINHHAYKNALIPTIMVSSLGFPVILGGLIAVETIYNWNGMGSLLFRGIQFSDYPVIIALVFIFSIVVICANLVGDILTAMLDPRIRLY